jgi:hypothetical protein
LSNDVQQQIDALRRDVDELRNTFQALRSQGSLGQDPVDVAGNALKEHLQRQLQEKGKRSGLSVATVIVQTNLNGSSGVTFGITTLDDVSDLPSDDRIAVKCARVAALVQNPLALRALRRLAEPFAEGRAMMRTRAELAGSLGASEAEVDEALRPLVASNTLQQKRTATGEEVYEWGGNDLAMVLLVSP